MHGVDGDSAQSGDGAGQSAAENEKRGDSGENERARVTVLGPVGKELVKCEKDQEPGEQAAGDGDADVAADNPEYVCALSSKSHADSKLVGALGHGVGYDAIEPDEREGQRKTGKKTEKDGKETLLLEFGLLLDPLIQVAHIEIGLLIRD